MIVSHKYKFVIAVPCGMGCGPWLNRIAAEGPEGYLEVVGHPNDVVVPEGCEKYARFFVDTPQTRLPRMYLAQIDNDVPWKLPPEELEEAGSSSLKRIERWLEWYAVRRRGHFTRMAAEDRKGNGWGMRSGHGEWAYFEHPTQLAQAFAGIGNHPARADAPWGRIAPKFMKLEEFSRGWKDVIKMVHGESQDAKDTRSLLRWHIPDMEKFYEIRDDLATLFLQEGAWNYVTKVRKQQSGDVSLFDQ